MTTRRLVAAVVAALALLSLGVVVLCGIWPHRCAQVREEFALRFPPNDCAGVAIPFVIAHAGGAVGQHTYSNSLEALDLNYTRGCRLFELDFEWTSDGELVLLHDWNAAATRIFGEEFGGQWRDRRSFLAARRLDELTSLDLEGLNRWLEDHTDASVVTDVKWDNVKALGKMRSAVTDAEHRLIPQIYGFDEIDGARALGFERIILTLYRSSATDAEVVDFVRTARPYAVAMPVGRAFGGLPAALGELGVPTLVHTVNSRHNARRLTALGAGGIYTDFLIACGTPTGELPP